MYKSMVWMLGTLLSFSFMAVAAKELSGQLATFQVLFFRSAISLLIISTILIVIGKRALITTSQLKWHGLRNVFHLAGQYGWFVAIGLLPLAEVFALEFTVPFWTAILAAALLKEALTLRKLTAITFGLVGVMVIVKPGFEQIQIGVGVMLVAAMCYAMAYISTKRLTQTEAPLTILFYMTLIQFPICLLFAIPDWQLPNGGQWLWLVMIAITALTAHYCLSQAMRYADSAVVVTMDYFRLPIIAFIGVLLYNEQVEMSLFIGASLMLFGNLVNFYQPKFKQEKRKQKKQSISQRDAN